RPLSVSRVRRDPNGSSRPWTLYINTDISIKPAKFSGTHDETKALEQRLGCDRAHGRRGCEHEGTRPDDDGHSQDGRGLGRNASDRCQATRAHTAADERSPARPNCEVQP